MFVEYSLIVKLDYISRNLITSMYSNGMYVVVNSREDVELYRVVRCLVDLCV